MQKKPTLVAVLALPEHSSRRLSMPRNLDDYVYLSVPLRKASPLYARLKEEAQRTDGTKRGQVGPYVTALLEDRDSQLYGEGKGQALWFLSHPTYLTSLVEAAVEKALASALPSLLASLPLTATRLPSLSDRVEAS